MLPSNDHRLHTAGTEGIMVFNFKNKLIMNQGKMLISIQTCMNDVTTVLEEEETYHYIWKEMY